MSAVSNEDEARLVRLGYKQEAKRIFWTGTTFGLAASMISVLLGIIPLYTFSLQTGGPVVMLWTYVGVGLMSIVLVSSLAEICSSYPTMGALYYWALCLGGRRARFWSWMAGWLNLLGQIAGVASGGYAGATVLANMVQLGHGYTMDSAEVLGVFGAMLVIAGIINTFAESLLTNICYVSVVWHIFGTLIIVILLLANAPTIKTTGWCLTQYNNDSDYDSTLYVVLIGSLSAASVFTGYDTAAHVAEETTDSHISTPIAMVTSVVNALVLGVILILGMNYSIQDLRSLLDQSTTDNQAYVILWKETLGATTANVFNFILLFGIECSNCANLTSASRMIYSLARDGALPYSEVWYCMDASYGGPVRAIWLVVLVAFLLGLPGLFNSVVLEALFSLTATGLYASYFIPLMLRATVSRNSFRPAEWNLGSWSWLLSVVSALWCLLMTVVLCLPNARPINSGNFNYSSIALGLVIVYAVVAWVFGAHVWFKANFDLKTLNAGDAISGPLLDTSFVGLSPPLADP